VKVTTFFGGGKGGTARGGLKTKSRRIERDPAALFSSPRIETAGLLRTTNRTEEEEDRIDRIDRI
jgi:hypothetical protein